MMWVWGVTVAWGAAGWTLYGVMAGRCQRLRKEAGRYRVAVFAGGDLTTYLRKNLPDPLCPQRKRDLDEVDLTDATTTIQRHSEWHTS